MTNVIATYTCDGSTREMPEVQAKVLQSLGRVTYEPVQERGMYLTRDMARQPAAVIVQKTVEPEVEQSEEDEPDDLDAMDKAELHALAKDLGLALHHATGEVKAREAIRAKRAEAP